MFNGLCQCGSSHLEDPGKLAVQALVEFLGTFILVQAIIYSVYSGQALAAIAIGSTLMVSIYAWGHISGAHYNPAVSTGFFVAGMISPMKWITFVMTQLIAGIVSGFIAVNLCKGEDLCGVDGQCSFPNISYGEGKKGLYTEFLWTFLLASVVLNTAGTCAEGYRNNSFFGLAIGFTVVAGAIAVGGFSGGAFNPAVASGLNIGQTSVDGYEFNASELITVVVFEFLGGVCAGIVFMITEWGERQVSQIKPKESISRGQRRPWAAAAGRLRRKKVNRKSAAPVNARAAPVYARAAPVDATRNPAWGEVSQPKESISAVEVNSMAAAPMDDTSAPMDATAEL